MFALGVSRLVRSRGRRVALVALAALPLIITVPALGAPDASWHQKAELRTSDDAYDFAASTALSADGTTALVSEYEFHTGLGAVVVFSNEGGVWHRTRTLLGSDHEPDRFGRALALSADGSTALIGVPAQGRDRGAAFVFERSNGQWHQSKVLIGADSVGADQFGTSVALSANGEVAAIGAPGHFRQRGAAYVFRDGANGWVQESELVGSTSVAFDALGSSVGMSGGGATVMVGAPYHDRGRGVAYVFSANGGTWHQVALLSGVHGVVGDEFGSEMAISSLGSTAIISAPDRASGRGLVYVFHKSLNGWQGAGSLLGPGLSLYDRFGSALALSRTGRTAIIGAPDAGEDDGGRAFVFSQVDGAWSEPQTLYSTDGDNLHEFAFSVAITSLGRKVLVGAPQNGSGAAYIFTAGR